MDYSTKRWEVTAGTMALLLTTNLIQCFLSEGRSEEGIDSPKHQVTAHRATSIAHHIVFHPLTTQPSAMRRRTP